MYVNEHVFESLGTAIFWLHLLIRRGTDRLNSTLNGNIPNQGTANEVNTFCSIHQEKKCESLTRNLFAINKHATANVCLLLLLLLLIIIIIIIIVITIINYYYYYYYYNTLNSLSLFWLAESAQWFFEISACDVITADYTIIMSRSRVIMSCMTAVHDFLR